MGSRSLDSNVEREMLQRQHDQEEEEETGNGVLMTRTRRGGNWASKRKRAALEKEEEDEEEEGTQQKQRHQTKSLDEEEGGSTCSSGSSTTSVKLRIVNPDTFNHAAMLQSENEALARGSFDDEKFALPYSPRQVLSPRAAVKGGPFSPPSGHQNHLIKALSSSSSSISISPPPKASEKLCKRTKLHDAILNEDMDMFTKCLRDKKMKMDEIDACMGQNGFSALMNAAGCKDEELGLKFCAQLLAKGADLRTVDHEGFSALHWAAAMGHAKIVDLLIAKGGDVNGQSLNGDTPLHRAARFGKEECISSLIMKHRTNLFTRNEELKTALDVAGEFCENEMLTNHLRVRVRKAFFGADPKLRTLILYHDDCLDHRTSQVHQEAPERISMIYDRIQRGVDREFIHTSSNFPSALKDQLLYAHNPKYIDFVFELHNKVAQLGAPVPFTPRVQAMNGVEEHKVKDEKGCDTFFSEGSLPAALRAVGAVCHAVDRVITGHNRNAFCVVRPPGHHAGVNGLLDNAISCGFCIFNNVAIGAMHVLTKYSKYVERVAIVDFDVHHGNGTEEIVRLKVKRPENLFFFSIHLYDKPGENVGCGEFYPGSGRDDIPEYNIINVPMIPIWKTAASGAPGGVSENDKVGRKAFREQIRTKLIPALKDFNPDFIFISAGFDAGKNDIGCCRTERGKYFSGIDLSAEDYFWTTKQIQSVADLCCEGRVVSILEGGYGQWKKSQNSKKSLVLNRDQLAENALSHVKALIM